MPKMTAAKLTPELPLGPVAKTLRRLSKPERRTAYRVLSGVLDGSIELPEKFFDGADLSHCYEAARKLEPKRGRK